jgi:nitroreductase
MKSIKTLIMALVITGPVFAQDIQPVKLNAPDLSRSTTMMKAFEMRASVTAVDSKDLSLQDLSDLLWAGNGINRPESGKRTAPSAMNSQDIDIYVFLSTGVYVYDAKNSTLNPVVAGDHRALFAGWGFENAPVFLLLIADISRYTRGDPAHILDMAKMDGGIVSQNIALFCAGAGLGTRPRAGMPAEELTKLLNLKPSQHLILNHPVGYLVKQ